ncbi:MAG: RNB domain-containing ribonuclease [Anaerolineae bacterium]
MPTSMQRASLVAHKNRPAVITQFGDKLEIQFADGKNLSVRAKDVVVLHPGPAQLNQLVPPQGDLISAWELLAGSAAPLAEVAELAYGAYTPASAWAVWQAVLDGLYFGGSPDAVTAHPLPQVAKEQAARAARAAEANAWTGFLERMQQRRFLPVDQRYLAEVEQLAYGQRDKSRVLGELGRTQTPESAHALLLELEAWDEMVNPHPRRLELPTTSPQLAVPPLPNEARTDLTHLPALAIDDEGSRDPDDALSVDGDRLWVHVADAAALVAPDSALDLEARGRGANLYLPEGTVTMLPWAATEQLGLGLQAVSPALSLGLRIQADGSVSDLAIVPSWVRVQRLTYEEAEWQLGDEPLRTLNRWAQQRTARRQAQGAISLDLPEARVRVVEGAVQITALPLLRSRDLVTELMLAAGEAVAHLAVAQQIPLPFTTQEPADLQDPPHTLAEMFAARRRFRPSQQSVTPGAHAGLGLPMYVRVTSPLRRYLDLITHQQLRRYLAGAPLLDEAALLERIGAAEAVTGAIRRAEQLARQHWTLVHLLRQPGWQGEGVVVEMAGTRATVLLPELAWELRAHLREDLPLDSPVQVMFIGANLPLLDAHFKVR